MCRFSISHILSYVTLFFVFLAFFSEDLISAETQQVNRNFRVVHLQCEDKINPIGIDDQSPDFNWKYDIQSVEDSPTHYQILVASDSSKLTSQSADLWDSGKVVLSKSAVSYKGKNLSSRQRAYWTVRIWDSKGNVSNFADAAFFEMGLLNISDWNAYWIWSDSLEKDESIQLRRSLPELKSNIIRARIYITAAHRYEIFLNNIQLSSGPNFGDKFQRYYQTIALDPNLFNSSNKLKFITIKAHWLGSGQGRPDLKRGVLIRMELLDANGNEHVVISNKEWLTRRSEWYLDKTSEGALMRYRNSEGVPIESIDARINANYELSQNGDTNLNTDWKAAIEIADTQAGLAEARLVAQTTKIEEQLINPISVTKLNDQYYLADFGKIYAATPMVNFPSGISDKKINIAGAYHLDDSGRAITTEQRSDLSYRYIMSGKTGGETFKPFWYLGMRYLAIENSPVTLEAKDIKLLARKNSISGPTADFSSSDSILNSLWELAVHSASYGAQEQFIDTPTREQGQFSYDSYLIGTALAEIASERLLNKQALREFANSQLQYNPADGRLDAAYPNGGVVQDIADWTMIWPIWAWEFYKISCDDEIIFDLYPELIKTAHWVESKISTVTGLIDLGNSKQSESGFVDWPDRYDYDLSTSQRTVMNAYAVMLFDAVSELSSVVGNRANKDHFNLLSSRLKKSIKIKLWNQQSKSFIDGIRPDGSKSSHASEQANAMLLASGIADYNQISGALSRINETKPSTSVVLSRFLVSALGEHHQTDRLLNYLRIPNGRNFAQIIKDGGTFTYESWSGRNSITGEGESESHAYGAYTIIRALLRYVAGIKCDSIGCQNFTIYPHFADVSWVKAQLPIASGMLKVSWQGPENLIIEVPYLTKGSVCLPIKREPNKKISIYLDNQIVEYSRKIDGCLFIENIGPGIHELKVSSI